MGSAKWALHPVHAHADVEDFFSTTPDVDDRLAKVGHRFEGQYERLAVSHGIHPDRGFVHEWRGLGTVAGAAGRLYLGWPPTSLAIAAGA